MGCNYLPPLKVVKVDDLQNIGDNFENLLNEILKEDVEQFFDYGNYMEILLKIVFLFLNLFKKP